MGWQRAGKTGERAVGRTGPGAVKPRQASASQSAWGLQQAGATDRGTRLGVDRGAVVWAERQGAGGEHALVESQGQRSDHRA